MNDLSELLYVHTLATVSTILFLSFPDHTLPPSPPTQVRPHPRLPGPAATTNGPLPQGPPPGSRDGGFTLPGARCTAPTARPAVGMRKYGLGERGRGASTFRHQGGEGRRCAAWRSSNCFHCHAWIACTSAAFSSGGGDVALSPHLSPNSFPSSLFLIMHPLPLQVPAKP